MGAPGDFAPRRLRLRPLRPFATSGRRLGGALIGSVDDHLGRIAAVAFAPDGRVLSGSADGTVKLWDLRSREILRTFTGHWNGVTALAIAAEGRRVLSGAGDGTLAVWDLASGELGRRFAAHDGAITAVAISPDGTGALSASLDGTLTLWDLGLGERLRRFTGLATPISAVAMTPGGTRALTASLDEEVILRDMVTGERLRAFAGGDAITALAIRPDGESVLFGTCCGYVDAREVSTGEPIGQLRQHGGPLMPVNVAVGALAVSPDGRLALSASLDRTLKLWDLCYRAPSDDQRDEWVPGAALRRGDCPWVTAVAVTADQRFVVTGTTGEAARLWDLCSGERLATLEGCTERITAAAITPCGRSILAGARDGELHLWDRASGKRLRIIAAHRPYRVRAVAITPDGQRALSAAYDGSLKLLDLASGTVPRTLLDSGTVTWVVVTPDGACAVSGSKPVVVWDLATGRRLRTLPARDPVVAFTPDGRAALSAGGRSLELWDLCTGDQLASASEALPVSRGITRLHRAAPHPPIAISPDGRNILVGFRREPWFSMEEE